MQIHLRQLFWALLSGALFATGLILSGMANPAKVLGFLALTGAWDPSLLLVMIGAIPVAAIGFRLHAIRHAAGQVPALAVTNPRSVDKRLLTGAVIFGIGWGLVGICPGPAIVLTLISPTTGGIFLLALITGNLLFHFLNLRYHKAEKHNADEYNTPSSHSVG